MDEHLDALHYKYDQFPLSPCLRNAALCVFSRVVICTTTRGSDCCMCHEGKNAPPTDRQLVAKILFTFTDFDGCLPEGHD